MMILALGRDGDAHITWLRKLLDRPVMTANKPDGIRNLLPIASAVFIQASSYAWKSHLDMPDHPAIYMVGQTGENSVAEHCMRNFREASIKDVYLVGNADDEQRLVLRFQEQVIEEVADDEKGVRGASRRSNGRLGSHGVQAVPAEPF